MGLRHVRAALCTGIVVATAPGSASALPSHECSGYYVPSPNPGAIEQIIGLVVSGDLTDAAQIAKMILTPQAVWITGGAPAEAERRVRRIVRRAAMQRRVPVLVAYNIPFRDCAQLSAGGATTVAEYKAWVDGFAAGIGAREAVVILEPDGLGIIPFYKQFRGTDAEAPGYEWCQPDAADEGTAADERFEMLNYAVGVLKAKPRVSVYLDGTHSGWLGSGDAAHRLIQAGVADADGFFLNVSNYRLDEHLLKYGRWISDCIYLSVSTWWQVQWCASQYYPADPNDFGTWVLSDAAYDQAFADTGLQRDPEKQAHFVIDASRNGQGAWTPAVSYPDPQDWCNPPDRGLGVRPTSATGNQLVDAYLWIKIPGESDGPCARGLGTPGETVDPEWGRIDPAAGAWFSEMALDLVNYAEPPLEIYWP